MASSPFQLSLRDLPRRPGSAINLDLDIPAPESFATELVRAVGDIHCSLSLQSVSEGVLVTGSAQVAVEAECARCLRAIDSEISVQPTELFYYPHRVTELVEAGDEEAEEAPQVVGEAVDIEPVLRDDIVSRMPFIPLCSPDCAGLCDRCGEPLDELPEDHAHEEPAAEPSPLDALREQLIAEQDK
ncbi:MAG: YceD family protein [Flaviflexus sp.]|nr:YceD family protein [Flaviflexus sp.]